jgi:ABC-type bacteriocin/lantibiotic exporter with double-glycine peptidase domain
MRQYRREIYQIYIYAVLSGLVNLSLPLGIQAIFNFIQGNQMSTSWMILVGFVLAGIAVSGILQVLQLRIAENIQQDLFARSSFEFAYRIPRIKLSVLERLHAPELVNRFFDTLTIQKGLPKILIDFALASFQVIFGLMLLAVYSPYFIILGLVLCFVLYLIFRFTGPKGLQTSLKESKYKYKLAHWLEEIAKTNKGFKLSASGNLHMDNTDSIATDYLEYREKHYRVLLSQFRFFIVFKVLVAAGLLILGSILVFEQQMNLGQFVASEIIIIIIINSVEKLIQIIETIYDVLTALEKIGFVTDLPLDEPSKAQFPAPDKGIELEAVDLDFSFPDMKKKLISELSFRIHSGARVQVTGASGSGKSTLLHLLSGMYPCDGGELLINQMPLQNFDLESMHEHIGFYSHSSQLFEGSILENISMGRPVSEKEVFDILTPLGLRHFISQQPKGLQTTICSEGQGLPKSITQKLLIARTIVHRPKLLLMDDPVLHVRMEEKSEIIDYLTSTDHDWTLVVVSDSPLWNKKTSQRINLTNHA